MSAGSRELMQPSSGHPARPLAATHGRPQGPPPAASELLASAGAGVGDFRKLGPRRQPGKEGPRRLPRPRGAGGGVGQEPGWPLEPCRGVASAGESRGAAAAAGSAPRLGSWDRAAVGERQSTVPSSS